MRLPPDEVAVARRRRRRWRRGIGGGGELPSIGFHAVAAKPIKERGFKSRGAILPAKTQRPRSSIAREQACEQPCDTLDRSRGRGSGAHAMVCFATFRTLASGFGASIVRTVTSCSTDGAYISVQKLAQSFAGAAQQDFFSCLFPSWPQNVPAAAMRSHCGTTLGFDGGYYMTCSKNLGRLLQASCLGLIGMLTVVGCGGSENTPHKDGSPRGWSARHQTEVARRQHG